jgi:hypothetical protein
MIFLRTTFWEDCYMRATWLVCLLLCGLALGQVATPAAAPQAGASTAEAGKTPESVKPDDPVITVKSPCDDATKRGEVCDTVVTREQFEKLADSLQPGMSPPIKIRLANALAKLAVMSKEAEKRGLDKSPRYEETLRFARMQILSQQLTASLQEEAQKVSDADIEKYYNENTTNYQEASLLRLYVPVSKQIQPPKVTAAKATVKKSPNAEKEEMEAREKAGKAAMQKTADLLRARAAKGEDFDVLEKEAYLSAGLKGNPPSTKMEKVRPNTLPPSHKVALDLKPGEVSPVISDASGHYVYKLAGKHALPLESVKAEIKNWLAAERFRDAMQQYGGTSQLNDAYFGIPSKPKPVPGKPGSEPEQESVEPD